MRQKHLAFDTLIEANPAYCSIVLADACDAYSRQRVGKGMPFVLTPLILPLVLTIDLEPAFSGLRIDSGLSRFADRASLKLHSIPEIIKSSLDITREALSFAMNFKLLQIDDDACLHSSAGALTKKRLNRAGFKQISSNTRRLGAWFAMEPNAATIYNILDVMP